MMNSCLIFQALVLSLYTILSTIQATPAFPTHVKATLMKRLSQKNVLPLLCRMMRAHALHFEAQHTIFTLIFLLLQVWFFLSSFRSHATVRIILLSWNFNQNAEHQDGR